MTNVVMRAGHTDTSEDTRMAKPAIESAASDSPAGPCRRTDPNVDLDTGSKSHSLPFGAWLRHTNSPVTPTSGWWPR